MEPLVVAVVCKRTEPWQGRFMSSAARLVFTDACLLSLLIFAMDLFLLADGTHVGFDKHRGKFFWEGKGKKRKYHWVNWPEVCRPKDQGGLGVMNTKLMNIALMAKWIWRIFAESPANSLWLCIIKAKYPGLLMCSTLPRMVAPLSGTVFTRSKISLSLGCPSSLEMVPAFCSGQIGGLVRLLSTPAFLGCSVLLLIQTCG
jgi:hypothetical protein